MTRESKLYGVVIGAVLLLLAAFFLLDAGDSNTSTGGVMVRMGSMAPAQPGEAPPPQAGDRSEVQRLIDSGQFAPPPGNPAKMYSIASPFSTDAPVATSTTSPGTPARASGFQPGVTMLGANSAGNPPAPAVTRNAPVAASPATSPPQNQPIEFETPPGIGSTRGGQ